MNELSQETKNKIQTERSCPHNRVQLLEDRITVFHKCLDCGKILGNPLYIGAPKSEWR